MLPTESDISSAIASARWYAFMISWGGEGYIHIVAGVRWAMEGWG